MSSDYQDFKINIKINPHKEVVQKSYEGYRYPYASFLGIGMLGVGILLFSFLMATGVGGIALLTGAALGGSIAAVTLGPAALGLIVGRFLDRIFFQKLKKIIENSTSEKRDGTLTLGANTAYQKKLDRLMEHEKTMLLHDHNGLSSPLKNQLKRLEEKGAAVPYDSYTREREITNAFNMPHLEAEDSLHYFLKGKMSLRRLMSSHENIDKLLEDDKNVAQINKDTHRMQRVFGPYDPEKDEKPAIGTLHSMEEFRDQLRVTGIVDQSIQDLVMLATSQTDFGITNITQLFNHFLFNMMEKTIMKSHPEYTNRNASIAQKSQAKSEAKRKQIENDFFFVINAGENGMAKITYYATLKNNEVTLAQYQMDFEISQEKPYVELAAISVEVLDDEAANEMHQKVPRDLKLDEKFRLNATQRALLREDAKNQILNDVDEQLLKQAPRISAHSLSDRLLEDVANTTAQHDLAAAEDSDGEEGVAKEENLENHQKNKR